MLAIALLVCCAAQLFQTAHLASPHGRLAKPRFATTLSAPLLHTQAPLLRAPAPQASVAVLTTRAAPYALYWVAGLLVGGLASRSRIRVGAEVDQAILAPARLARAKSLVGGGDDGDGPSGGDGEGGGGGGGGFGGESGYIAEGHGIAGRLKHAARVSGFAASCVVDSGKEILHDPSAHAHHHHGHAHGRHRRPDASHRSESEKAVADFDARIRRGKSVVLLSSAKCGSCRMADYFFDNLKDSQQYPDIAFVRVDIGSEEGKVMCGRYGVQVLPTILYFSDGETFGTPTRGGIAAYDLDQGVRALAEAANPTCTRTGLEQVFGRGYLSRSLALQQFWKQHLGRAGSFLRRVRAGNKPISISLS